ncbi:MAG: peptidoglycan-binding protein [Gammaproteobacteria bacterium]|nr:peptidoglycan-binding protein [Gammaproteobacteria bacterium]
MPKMLSYGAVGQEVRDMQAALNNHPPTGLPLLAVDGIFGPRTLARVKEFQGNSKLAVDGIVGPNTWSKLLTTKPAEIANRVGINCGTHDAGSRAIGEGLAKEFLSFANPSSAASPQSRFVQGTTAAAQSSSNPIRMLTDAQKTTAKSVYGNSLDFSRIFISNKTGLGGRPFTIAFPDSNQIVQIMNCGTFSPSQKLLIHELCHVWQSQHHSDQFKFMSNAVKCQGKAVADNTTETFVDPDILLHKDHPVQFPFSAYAYKPGLTLNQYAAEQMANAVEHGEAGVRTHVKSIAMNATDSNNVTALNLTVVGDRRQKGVKF